MIPAIPITQIPIGPVTIHFYGLIIGIAIIAGYTLAQKRATKYQISPSYLDSLLVWLLPSAIIGARIYHVLTNLQYYTQNPTSIIAIWEGGIGILGAIIASILILLYKSNKDKVPLLNLTDLLAPALALGQSIGRWGNYINQELFGPPTTLPWGLYIEVSKRPAHYQDTQTFHPAFLYESIANGVNCLILLYIAKNQNIKAGTITTLYLLQYGTIRLIMESFFRINTTLTAIILSSAMITIGLILLSKLYLNKPRLDSRKPNK